MPVGGHPWSYESPIPISGSRIDKQLRVNINGDLYLGTEIEIVHEFDGITVNITMPTAILGPYVDTRLADARETLKRNIKRLEEG